MDLISVPWNKAKRTELATYVIPTSGRWIDGATIAAAAAAENWNPRESVRLLYEHLARLGIIYSREPFHCDPGEQVIRPSYDVLISSKRGTCLDLSVMFAGLCLSFDLIPVLIIFENHVIAAVSTTRRWSDRTAVRPEAADYSDDAEPLHVQAVLCRAFDRGELITVECTGFAHDLQPGLDGRLNAPRLCFDEALRRGEELVRGPDFRYAVDIGVAYTRWGFKPRAIDETGIIQTLKFQSRAREVWSRVDELVEARIARPLVGRAPECSQLNAIVSMGRGERVFLTSKAGFGKTALLAHWVRECQQGGIAVVYHFFGQERGGAMTAVADCYRSLLEQIRSCTGALAAGDYEPVLRETLTKFVRDYRDGRPLVFVVDGLDEAEDAPVSPFPAKLPAGIVVVAAARTDPDLLGSELEAWQQDAQQITLDRLAPSAVKMLLELDDSPAVRELAADEELMDRLDEVASGFPLYLRYVIDDLREAPSKGRTAANVLQHTPIGLAAYVRRQFRLLARGSDFDPKVTDLFALLTITREPLEVDAVAHITGLDEFGLANLPRKIARWILVESECQGGCDFYSFAHPLLADEYRKLLHLRVHKLTQQLIDYCVKNWRSGSRYALRHVIRHLDDHGRDSEVVELALLEAFREQQMKLYPDAQLVINTLTRGLAASLRCANLGAVSEFVIRLGYIINIRPRGSPLAACTRADFKAVSRLIDNLDREAAMLMAMLIASHLERTGQHEWAHRIGRRIHFEWSEERSSNRAYDEVLIFLLPSLGLLFPERFPRFVELLLSKSAIPNLAAAIVSGIEIKDASRLLDSIEPLSDAPLDKQRTNLARRAARERDPRQALIIAAKVSAPLARKDAYLDVAIALQEQKCIDQARKAVNIFFEEQLDYSEYLEIQLFTKAIRAKAKCGDFGELRPIVDSVFSSITSKVSKEGRWFTMLLALEWQQILGPDWQPSVTVNTIRTALDACSDHEARVVGYIHLSDLLSESAEAAQVIDVILTSLSKLDNADFKQAARLVAARKLIAFGRADEARCQFEQAVVEACESSDDKLGRVLTVAETQAELGGAEDARATFVRAREVINGAVAVPNLVKLARAQGRSALLEAARATLTEALAMLTFDVIDEKAESTRGRSSPANTSDASQVSQVRSLIRDHLKDLFLPMISSAYLYIGDLETAQELAERISDEAKRLPIIGSIARRLREANREFEAVALVEEMLLRSQAKKPEDIRLSLIDMLSGLGDGAAVKGRDAAAVMALDGATEILITQGRQSSSYYSRLWMLGLKQGLRGNRAAARILFSQLTKEINGIANPVARGRVHRELLESLLSMEDAACGSTILVNTFEHYMEVKKLQELWGLLVRDVCRELADPDLYDDNFREAISLIRDESLQRFQVTNYIELAIIYWRILGHSESVRNILAAALNVMAASEENWGSFDLANLLFTARWVGEHNWIQQNSLIEICKSQIWINRALFDAAMFERDSGRLTEATKLAEAIAAPILRANLLREIIRIGTSVDSADAIEHLQTLAETVDASPTQCRCYLELACVLADSGRISDSLTALEQAAETIDAVSEWPEDNLFP